MGFTVTDYRQATPIIPTADAWPQPPTAKLPITVDPQLYQQLVLYRSNLNDSNLRRIQTHFATKARSYPVSSRPAWSTIPDRRAPSGRFFLGRREAIETLSPVLGSNQPRFSWENRVWLNTGMSARKLALGMGPVQVGFRFDKTHFLPRELDLRFGAPQGSIGINLGDEVTTYARGTAGLVRMKYLDNGFTDYKITDEMRALYNVSRKDSPARHFRVLTVDDIAARNLVRNEGIEAAVAYMKKRYPTLPTDILKEAMNSARLGWGGAIAEFGGMLLLKSGFVYARKKDPTALEDLPLFAENFISSAIPISAVELTKAFLIGAFEPGIATGLRVSGVSTLNMITRLGAAMGGMALTSMALDSAAESLSGTSWNRYGQCIYEKGSWGRLFTEVGGAVAGDIAFSALKRAALGVVVTMAPETLAILATIAVVGAGVAAYNHVTEM